MENIFMALQDVIQNGICHQYYGVAYFPERKELSRVAISMEEGRNIKLDYMPLYGSEISTFSINDYGVKFWVLNYDFYPPWELMFLEENHKYKVLFPETGEVVETPIDVDTDGPDGRGKTLFGFMYHARYVYYERKDYEKKFVVLKPISKDLKKRMR